MDLKFLEFEQPIAELEARIDALKFVGEDSELNISEEISRLKNKSESLTRSIFSNLTAWQIAQLARHPQRPYTLDYLDKCFTDFQELHGDRMYADDHSLVGGLARLEGEAVVVIGHQKGRDTKERMWRNYGMARPEGYRKGAATDASRREVRPAADHVDRYGGRLSRHRRRGARPERGDRAQPVHDVESRACRSSAS